MGDPGQANGVNNLANKLPETAPRLSTARLRGRWIVDMLTDCVPVDVADLSTMKSIENYLPWVNDRDPHEFVTLLLGDEE